MINLYSIWYIWYYGNNTELYFDFGSSVRPYHIVNCYYLISVGPNTHYPRDVYKCNLKNIYNFTSLVYTLFVLNYDWLFDTIRCEWDIYIWPIPVDFNYNSNMYESVVFIDLFSIILYNYIVLYNIRILREL